MNIVNFGAAISNTLSYLLEHLDYTVFSAVLSGTLIYVLGQIILQTVLQPLQIRNQLLCSIASDLIMYARHFNDPKGHFADEHRAVSEIFRRHSSQLRALSDTIPLYWLIAKGPVTRASNTRATADHLMELSNSVGLNGVLYIPERMNATVDAIEYYIHGQFRSKQLFIYSNKN